jgi:hypothetical protein
MLIELLKHCSGSIARQLIPAHNKVKKRKARELGTTRRTSTLGSSH